VPTKPEPIMQGPRQPCKRVPEPIAIFPDPLRVSMVPAARRTRHKSRTRRPIATTHGEAPGDRRHPSRLRLSRRQPAGRPASMREDHPAEAPPVAFPRAGEQTDRRRMPSRPGAVPSRWEANRSRGVGRPSAPRQGTGGPEWVRDDEPLYDPASGRGSGGLSPSGIPVPISGERHSAPRGLRPRGLPVRVHRSTLLHTVDIQDKPLTMAPWPITALLRRILRHRESALIMQ
jgi:hypothetical protein